MLRIGEFAALGRVTVKALRHYDAAGLLRPSEVDPQSGYRYYAPEQLSDLSRILLLKDFGFSLEEIGELARRGEPLTLALARRRETLRASIQNDIARLKRLEAFERTLADGASPPPIRVRSLPPVMAFTIREAAPRDGGRITELFEHAERAVARARARDRSSPFLLFHEAGDGQGEGDVEVCIPVTPAGAGLPAARLVPGCGAAGVLLYEGPYQQTPAHLDRLAEWLRASGGALSGPIREVYHRFGADQRGYRLPAHVLANDPAAYLTELQMPLAEPKGSPP